MMVGLEIDGTSAALTPEADIVASTVDLLREKLLEAVSSGAASVTVDMAAVKVVDSMGIAVLIAANNSLKAKNGRLCLANLDEEIASLFRLMRLDQHIEMLAD